MRRPLKPFVTEYKGNNRRQKDATGAFGIEPDAPPSDAAPRKANKAAEPKGSSTRRGDSPRDTSRANDTARFASAQGEDSYEAALRAADALFSGAPAQRNPAPDTALLATDVFSAPIAETTLPSGGRILRVIDEAPDTALAEIEAERAPKRRGRKPGSKNKPKIPLVAETPMISAFHDMDEDDEGGPIAYPTPVAQGPRPLSPHTLSASVYLTSAVYPTIPQRVDRFPWIRTKLGPGEQWKRRLPKVIW